MKTSNKKRLNFLIAIFVGIILILLTCYFIMPKQNNYNATFVFEQKGDNYGNLY